MATEEAEAVVEIVLTAYGHPLVAVSYFKYLEQVLLASDDNWTAANWNFRRARKK